MDILVGLLYPLSVMLGQELVPLVSTAHMLPLYVVVLLTVCKKGDSKGILTSRIGFRDAIVFTVVLYEVCVHLFTYNNASLRKVHA